MTPAKDESTVYVDFHNADSEGFVRLNCSGTVEDLERLQIALREGLVLAVSDGEIRVKGTVSSPSAEGVWRLKVDWPEVFKKHSEI